MALQSIPEVTLRSGNAKKMPVLGLGLSAHPFPTAETVMKAVLEAIELGYRMFDTATLYGTEEALGEAILQALKIGLIKSRDDLFITSKLWCTDNYSDHVLPALQKTLQNLKLEYLDQYLIHFPVSMRPGADPFLPCPEDLVQFDIQSVWTAMEECQRLGLTKSIGVSNFTCKKLADILAFAKIPPAINQVEMNPAWQQGKLREFCEANGIKIVLESEVLMEIANSKGKSVAQIALRWAYEQGVIIVTKSYNKERLKQNLEIFEWQLSDEESKKIAEMPQRRANLGHMIVSGTGPFKSVEDIWDGEL